MMLDKILVFSNLLKLCWWPYWSIFPVQEKMCLLFGGWFIVIYLFADLGLCLSVGGFFCGEDFVFDLGWEISIHLLSPFWSRMQIKSKISFTGFLSCSSLCQMEYWRPLVLLYSVPFFISTSTCLTCLEAVMSNYVCMYVCMWVYTHMFIYVFIRSPW